MRYIKLKNKEPLFDLNIFKNWNYSFATAILTMAFGIAYGSIAILPMFLQSLLGYNAYWSGLAAGPMGIGTVIGIVTCGAIAKIVDLRKQVMVGLFTVAVGCLMFSSLNLNIAISNVIIPNIIIGIGLTFCVIPSTTLIYSNVSKEEMTNASSLQNLVKNVGCAVGTSSVGVLVSRYAQIHQGYLVDRMTTLNSAFTERLDTMPGAFMQMGADVLTAQTQAAGMLYRQLL